MKSYEEMADSALSKIAEIEKEVQKRKKMMVRTAIPSALCAALLLGAGLYGGVRQLPLSPSQAAAGTVSGFVQDRIVVNTVDFDSADKINVTLSPNDFVKMNPDELNQYYGINIFPAVPSDLVNWDTAEDFSGYGIYRRENGAGSVYWDQLVLNYSNGDFSRTVNLEVAKGEQPLMDFTVASDDIKTSLISGTAVCLFCNSSGIYQARFLCHDTGFVLTADGLSRDEVISVIRSIVE